MARFGEKKDQFEKRYREKNGTNRVPYAAPFKIGTQQAKSSLRECLNELSELAELLQKHRRERNKRVHEIASITAQRGIVLLREQRRPASKTKNKTVPKFHDEALPPAIGDMKLWFGRLMKAASLAFEFEYFDRVKA